MRTILLIISGIVVALWVLGLLIGVWLPDVLFAPRKTIASAALTNGYQFKVVQYWNRCDFYSTELLVTSPHGKSQSYTLDGDDSKSWSVPLQVNEQLKYVTVTLGGNRTKTVNYY